MPGRLSTTTRTATNVIGASADVRRSARTAPAGTTITVSPHGVHLGAGGTVVLTVDDRARPTADGGQYFGEIHLDAQDGRPAAAAPARSRSGPAGRVDVSSSSACADASIARADSRRCTVTAQNNVVTATPTVDLSTTVNNQARHHRGRPGAEQTGNRSGAPERRRCCAGARPASRRSRPGRSGRVPPARPLRRRRRSPIGDEEIVNFNVPAFVYDGVTYTTHRRRLQRLPRRRRRHREDNNVLQPARRTRTRRRPTTSWRRSGPTSTARAPRASWSASLTDGTQRLDRRRVAASTCSARPISAASRCGSGQRRPQDITFAYAPRRPTRPASSSWSAPRTSTATAPCRRPCRRRPGA